MNEAIQKLLEYENLHYIVGAIIIVLVAYFKFRKFTAILDMSYGFFKWLKPSFEDNNGHSSSRRLTAFSIVCTYIACRVSYAKHVTDNYYLLAALVVDALFSLLLFGIVTFQQIASLKDINIKSNMKKILEENKEDKI